MNENSEKSELYLLITYAPITHAHHIRESLSMTKAGTLDDGYDSYSSTTSCISRFRPLAGSNPTIGSIGHVEIVQEEKIETIVMQKYLSDTLISLEKVHPYEKPCIIVLPVNDYRFYIK
jgi:hypothetical protein